MLSLFWDSKGLYRTNQISVRKMIYLIINIGIYTSIFGTHGRNGPREGYLVINLSFHYKTRQLAHWSFMHGMYLIYNLKVSFLK